MPYKTVNLREFAEQQGIFMEAMVEQMKAAAVNGAYRSIPDLVAASPVDTGHYANSWEVVETEDAVYIGNTAPHSPMIEHGARPFTPPLAPLLAWAKRVLQDPSQPPSYSPHVQALARYTQKKIQKYGMVPRKILENAIPKILANMMDEMEKI